MINLYLRKTSPIWERHIHYQVEDRDGNIVGGIDIYDGKFDAYAVMPDPLFEGETLTPEVGIFNNKKEALDAIRNALAEGS